MKKTGLPKKISKKSVEVKLKLSPGLSYDDSKDIFEQLFQSFPDIIHSVNTKGLIVSTNQRAVELLGYSRDELVGKNIFDLYSDDIKAQVMKGFKELKKEGIKERIESKLKTKDGSIIPVEIRSFSLYDQNNNFVKTFSILRDMRELNNLKSQVIQQSKLAAIGELASGIMHDIRNPLSIISSYNSLLTEAITKKDVKTLEKCQKSIEKAAKRIERITAHLRRFTRQELETPEMFLLSNILEDSLLMVEGRIKDTDTNIDNQLRTSIVTLVGRPNQLEQVFINILSNACDAMTKTETRELIISAEETADSVSVSFKDTGVGIKEKDLEHIFETFYTTKAKDEGTGLGLSICSRIMKQEGGKILVKSQFGKGSEFIVVIPKHVNKPLVKPARLKK